jgi:hypothetical protein
MAEWVPAVSQVRLHQHTRCGNTRDLHRANALPRVMIVEIFSQWIFETVRFADIDGVSDPPPPPCRRHRHLARHSSWFRSGEGITDTVADSDRPEEEVAR